MSNHRARDAEPDGGANDIPSCFLEGVEQLLALQPFDLRVERRHRRRRRPLGARGLREKVERLRIDVRRLGQHSHTLHHVGEFANVARPSVRAQRGSRARRQTLRRKPVVLTRAREEMFGEDRDVLTALAKRRQAQRHDGETVIEILAESTGMNRRQNIFVCRSDDGASTGSLRVLPSRRTLRSPMMFRSLAWNASVWSATSSSRMVPPCAL